MKRLRPTTVLLSLLLVASSVTALHFRAEALRLRQELVDRAEAAGESQAGPIPIISRTSPGDSPPMAAAVEGTGTGSESAPAVDASPRRPDRPNRGRDFATRMMNDPEAREAMLGRMRREVDRTYGDLFIKLGLNEDQAEMLRSLLADRQMARMQGAFLARSAEGDAAAEGARIFTEAENAAFESGVAALLGADGMAVIEDYQRSQPQRQAVSDVARRASYAGAPLSAETSDQLVSVMQEVSSRVSAAYPFSRGEVATAESVDAYLASLRNQNEAVLARAGSFLTQPQLEALASQQIEQFEQTKIQLSLRLRNPDAGGFGGFGGGPPGFGGGRGGPP